MSDLYKASGVDVTKGYEAVERMKKHVDKTLTPHVLTQLGEFAGAFSISDYHYQAPVLVSGTDGVGTKVILAQKAQRHHTIGIDCVAMCVNDILAQGARPLFFLDYLALGRNDPKIVERIIEGVANGYQQGNMALIGGETAEMPDLYGADEYDLAGFSVGIADKEQLLNKNNVEAGDCLIALPSHGLHSNGYSLVRKVLFKDNDYPFDYKLPSGKLLIDELLEPTRIYVKDVLPLLENNVISGIAHITGGGFYENIPRILPNHLQADIMSHTLPNYEIFDFLKEVGQMSDKSMFGTFNMGVGMILAVKEADVTSVTEVIDDSYVIGRVTQRSDFNSNPVVFKEAE